MRKRMLPDFVGTVIVGSLIDFCLIPLAFVWRPA